MLPTQEKNRPQVEIDHEVIEVMADLHREGYITDYTLVYMEEDTKEFDGWIKAEFRGENVTNINAHIRAVNKEAQLVERLKEEVEAVKSFQDRYTEGKTLTELDKDFMGEAYIKVYQRYLERVYGLASYNREGKLSRALREIQVVTIPEKTRQGNTEEVNMTREYRNSEITYRECDICERLVVWESKPSPAVCKRCATDVFLKLVEEEIIEVPRY